MDSAHPWMRLSAGLRPLVLMTYRLQVYQLVDIPLEG